MFVSYLFLFIYWAAIHESSLDQFRIFEGNSFFMYKYKQFYFGNVDKGMVKELTVLFVGYRITLKFNITLLPKKNLIVSQLKIY